MVESTEWRGRVIRCIRKIVGISTPKFSPTLTAAFVSSSHSQIMYIERPGRE